MDTTLTAETGRTPGSRSSSRMRADGRVPGVVYGLGRGTVSLSVPWPELRRALSTDAGLNVLLTLKVDGETDLAIVKDIQRHPVRRSVTHIDFLRVDPDAAVAIDVPIIVLGEAKEVENRRGVVDQPLKSLTVNAKPANIPSQLEVTIDDIDIGDTITVGELVLPDGVTTDVDPESPVVVGMATRFSVQLDHGVDPADLEDGLETPESAEAAAAGEGEDGEGEGESSDEGDGDSAGEADAE